MAAQRPYTILLGGLGGDSHSVGLTILRQALLAQGYEVRFLGPQNTLDAFFEWAGACNVVMMSSADGHAPRYLRDFPAMRRALSGDGPLWYLGGNLSIDDGCGWERHFYEMGFDRVAVRFMDLREVLDHLRRDLEHVTPAAESTALWNASRRASGAMLAAVGDEPLSLEALGHARTDVLRGWPTGAAAANLEENAAALAEQPSWAAAQAAVLDGRAPMLVQPRSGVALPDGQVRLFRAFRAAGARVLSYQVDSLTRNNDYAGAQEEIAASRALGTSTLNGFPCVNHGVRHLRGIARAVGVPLQTRHSTRDPRLLAEISYAGGVTAYEGGAICYNIPYYKDYPLAEAIQKWQYVDRLTGLYHERFGLRLDREFFGTLTATLVPPSLAITVNLLEMLLATRQGVKSVSLGYAEQGHRIQDIAAIRVMREMAIDLVRGLGYTDVQVNTVFHQYMAAFPGEPARAEELIFESGRTAALSGATRLLTKTPVEAWRVPTVADNLHGIQLAMQGIAAAPELVPDAALVEEECRIIRREVEALLDGVIRAGHGCVAAGIVAAFRGGLLDIPFSSSIHNRGEVLTARDASGAVRYLNVGKLPFDRDTRVFQRERMSERRRAEGLSAREDYLLVERDVMRIARGEYERWPLFCGCETRGAEPVRHEALALAAV